MKALLLASAIFLGGVSLAHSQQSCGDKTNQTDMNICAGQAYSKADRELNSVYKQIAGRLKDDPATTKLLVTAQKAWIAFRDGECNFSSSTVQGGSAYPFVSSSCLHDKTASRIEDLKAYLKCADGDLDCPVPAK
ncbi:lysozyme inhibitor LprI family protein [Phyllobacterium sp. K27]